MERRHLRIAFITLIAAATAACAPGVPNVLPLPAATSFDGYAAHFCLAFDAMFKAVGNPDTASGSESSKALDSAVTAHDGLTADRLAAQITAELESGRREVAAAAGWAPAAPMMAQLDRVFVAFEAMTAAKAAKARGEPNAVDPQAAFEQAGGVEAWFAMFDAGRAMGSENPADAPPCANVPVSP